MSSRRIAVVATVPAAADPAFYAAMSAADVTVRVGWDPEQIAEHAGAVDADVVIAAGGDGTVNVVASALASRAEPPALAVLAGGTANDFATALAIPPDPAEALRIARTAPLRPIDLGCVGEHQFINVASGGPAAETTADVSSASKKWLGGLAYVLSNLAKLADLPRIGARFTAPGFEWSGEINGFAVSNGALAGGGIRVAPHALIDDGRLDLTIAPVLETGVFTAAVADFFRPAWDAEFEHLIYRQVTEVTVETDMPVQVNLDGEPIHGRRFEFRVLPGALRLAMPDASELSAREG